MNVVRILGKVPIVNFASEFIEGYIPLVDEYFYCECWGSVEGESDGTDSS
jgi:hypothetical protein